MLESAQQQVPRFTFASATARSPLPIQADNSEQRADSQTAFYSEPDPETIGIDGSRRASDLYSPELNLEAHRTAQQVSFSNIKFFFKLYFNILIYIQII